MRDYEDEDMYDIKPPTGRSDADDVSDVQDDLEEEYSMDVEEKEESSSDSDSFSLHGCAEQEDVENSNHRIS